MIDVFAETTAPVAATVVAGFTVLLATVTPGCVFVETFIEDAVCAFVTATVVTAPVTLPLIAVEPAVAVVVVTVLAAATVVVVTGIKVDRAEFGLDPAGGTAAILPDIVVVIKLDGFACVLATVAAAAAATGTAAVVVLAVMLSPPPAVTKVDIVLHSRPLLIVPDDSTLVVAAATVAVVGVATFLAVFSLSPSPAISGCLLGLTSGNALGCGTCCG